MFKMNIDVNILSDSMCFDSGTKICQYKDGKDTVEIEVRGKVRVIYKGTAYTRYSEMPKKLKELFNTGKAYYDELVQIEASNWYEVLFNNDEDYDIAEVEHYHSEQLEAYCKECMELFKTRHS